MKQPFRCLILAALGVAIGSTASAGELKITMTEGRVTVIAQDVPLRQILAEWSRVGNTKMVNAEKLAGGPISLQLVDVPEKEALDILLRSAAGYMTAQRPTLVAGASLYDRVIILPTSRPPAGNAVTTTPPPFGINRPPAPVTLPQAPADDDAAEHPPEQGAVPAPGQPAGTQPFPGPMIGPNGQLIGPNGQPIGPNMPPGFQPVPGNQVPMTSPRPGMLPAQPQPQQINPYTPVGPDGRPLPIPARPGGR